METIRTITTVIVPLLNLLIKYEPALEKDVRDILSIIDRIHAAIAPQPKSP